MRQRIDADTLHRLSLPLGKGVATHLQRRAAEGDAALEIDELGTWVRFAGVADRILLAANPPDPVTLPAIVHPSSGQFCATADVRRARTRFIDDEERCRWFSKFAIGTTTVQVVFLAGPSVGWTVARKQRMLSKVIGAGVGLIKGLAREGGAAYAAPDIIIASPDLDSKHPSVNPTHYPIPQPPPADPINPWETYVLHAKRFLSDQGFDPGSLDTWEGEWNAPRFLQALYDYVNRLRNDHGTDWGYLLLVAPDDGATAAPWAVDARAWAAIEHGFFLLFEQRNDANEAAVFAHETMHMFGAADEYVDHPSVPKEVDACRAQRAGLYQVQNIRCSDTSADACLMKHPYVGDPGYGKICSVSAEQIGLIIDGGSFKPLGDFIGHGYQADDDGYFKNPNGVRLRSDVIRQGKSAYIAVGGWSKLSGLYQPHGPEGDLEHLGDSSYLMPGVPMNCVIGRWMSLDGNRTSSWFQIGAAAKWFGPTPYDAYLMFNINDQSGGFWDNSGRMTVEMYTRLQDNFGRPFIEHPPTAEVQTLDAGSTRYGVRDLPLAVHTAERTTPERMRSAPTPAVSQDDM